VRTVFQVLTEAARRQQECRSVFQFETLLVTAATDPLLLDMEHVNKTFNQAKSDLVPRVTAAGTAIPVSIMRGKLS